MLYKNQNNAITKFLKIKSDCIVNSMIEMTNGKTGMIVKKYSSNCFPIGNKKHPIEITQCLFFFLNNNNIQSKEKCYNVIRNFQTMHFATISGKESNVIREPVKHVTADESPSKDMCISIFQNPNALVYFNKNEPETLGQRIYRYLDITGFLTRYNNRKEWILDLDPYTRLSTVMLTEYERKLMIFLKFHVYLLFVICLYLWYHAQVHFTMKPPCPKPYAYGHLDGRKRDFTWHGRLFFLYPKMRCKDCRWLDVQCKKECFEKLKLEGHKFIINKGDPLSVPKTVLYPPHFH